MIPAILPALAAAARRGVLRKLVRDAWLGGFSVWEWPPGDGGPDDRGCTPENKPAEEVLCEWLAKPAWEVEVE